MLPKRVRNATVGLVDRRGMAEEPVDTCDQAGPRVEGGNVEAFHQHATFARHVPSVPVAVVVVIDLGRDHECVVRFARPEIPNRTLQRPGCRRTNRGGRSTPRPRSRRRRDGGEPVRHRVRSRPSNRPRARRASAHPTRVDGTAHAQGRRAAGHAVLRRCYVSQALAGDPYFEHRRHEHRTSTGNRRASMSATNHDYESLLWAESSDMGALLDEIDDADVRSGQPVRRMAGARRDVAHGARAHHADAADDRPAGQVPLQRAQGIQARLGGIWLGPLAG